MHAMPENEDLIFSYDINESHSASVELFRWLPNWDRPLPGFLENLVKNGNVKIVCSLTSDSCKIYNLQITQQISDNLSDVLIVQPGDYLIYFKDLESLCVARDHLKVQKMFTRVKASKVNKLMTTNYLLENY